MSLHDAVIRSKIWLEKDGTPIVGGGGAELLRLIDEHGSLSRAAEIMHLSYRSAWGQIKDISAGLGADVVVSVRGGTHGGETQLTDEGKKILREYHEISTALESIAAEQHFWESIGVKLSARNQLKGEIVDVEKGEITAKVKVKLEPAEITAVITKEAVEELELKKGESVRAIIKSTEIMIAKDE